MNAAVGACMGRSPCWSDGGNSRATVSGSPEAPELSSDRQGEGPTRTYHQSGVGWEVSQKDSDLGVHWQWSICNLTIEFKSTLVFRDCLFNVFKKFNEFDGEIASRSLET